MPACLVSAPVPVPVLTLVPASCSYVLRTRAERRSVDLVTHPLPTEVLPVNYPRVQRPTTDTCHAPTSTGDECADECADSGSHTLTDGCSMCVYVHEDGTTCEGDTCTLDLVHYTADEDGTPYALTRTMFTEDEAR